MKANDIFLWRLSIILSFIALGIIFYKWYHVNSKDLPGKDNFSDAIIYINKNNKQQIINNWKKDNKLKTQIIYEIPTGFFIQSFAFQSPYEINFTGYIWQKYPNNYPDTLKKGIIFPEAINSSGIFMDTIYYSEESDHKLIGWYFDVTVRQIFDYRKYPLDNITAWLRIWPKEFNYDENIILVPDFDSYDFNTSNNFNTEESKKNAIKGIDADVVSGEWEIDTTFFSYHIVTYNTNFGFSRDNAVDNVNEQYSELYINLGLHRKFYDASILIIVPLLLVAIFLFAQIMTVTGDKNLTSKFGFSASGAIATCSALFFTVLLAHIQVRRQFLDSPKVYIEHFYLIMYFIIFLTAFNSYVFPLGKQNSWLNLIYYRDNLIPKVAFWPTLLWLIAIVSIVIL